MNRRMMFGMCLAVASMFASEAVYASTSVQVPVAAMFGKTKLIKFSLRNDSGGELKVKAGESPMTIEAGKSVDLQLPVGAKVIADSDTAVHKSGDVIAEVSSNLSGVTVAVK